MPTFTPASEDTRVYECAVLYPYPLSQKEEQDVLKQVESLFEEADGKLLFKDVWGRRGLAYTIGGYDEGNYVIYYYDIAPDKIRDIDQQLRITKGVLRHLIVKPPKEYQVLSYADEYVKWQQDQKQADERAAAAREEKLRKQVVEKAKRQTKAAPRKPEASAEPAAPKDLNKELDKLISDKDLEL